MWPLPASTPRPDEDDFVATAWMRPDKRRTRARRRRVPADRSLLSLPPLPLLPVEVMLWELSLDSRRCRCGTAGMAMAADMVGLLHDTWRGRN